MDWLLNSDNGHVVLGFALVVIVFLVGYTLTYLQEKYEFSKKVDWVVISAIVLVIFYYVCMGLGSIVAALWKVFL